MIKLFYYREKHQEILSKIKCRACGFKIQNRDGKYCYPKSKMDFQESFKTLFDVDVATEPSTIYPDKICEGCKRQFEKHRANPTGYRAANKLVNFSGHTEDNCFVCTPRYVKPKCISLIVKPQEEDSFFPTLTGKNI